MSRRRTGRTSSSSSASSYAHPLGRAMAELLQPVLGGPHPADPRTGGRPGPRCGWRARRSWSRGSRPGRWASGWRPRARPWTRSSPAARLAWAGRVTRGGPRPWAGRRAPSLAKRLAACRKDRYRRTRQKAAHGYPHKETDRPPGAPKLRPATPAEVLAAKEVYDDKLAA
jgi:hypothetical protein